jgi:uncharacterized membrane protein YeaQ/YmgE (transglycosylase-associated protein family)
MIGMNFVSFIIVLIISAVVSYVLHYLLKYYVIPGFYSYLSKVVVGWIGAWLGSPVFGHWFERLSYGEVYIIPAVLGAFALEILVVDASHSFKGKKE